MLESSKEPLSNTQGTKFDSDKTMWSEEFLHWPALREVAEIMTFGAKKYGVGNWRLGIPTPKRRLISACMRHIIAYMCGEKIDPESGKHHICHAICNLMMLFAEEEKAGWTL